MVTMFPELMDCVEKRSDYEEYDIDQLRIRISSFSLLVSVLGQAMGAFWGVYLAEKRGYSFAFITGGIILIGFAVLYAGLCGLGDEGS